MQQTKSYWRFVAVAGVVSAFIASACVVTTSTDDSSGGTGGSGANGGSSTNGGSMSTAGSSSGAAGSHAGSGTAGSGTAGEGAVSFQCDPAGDGGAQGVGNSCEATDKTDDCQVCVQQKCCSEYSACYATDPGNQCGWGGPTTIKVDGKTVTNPGGELTCIHECLKAIVKDSMIAPTDSDVETCANNCATSPSNGATKDCGPVIGLQTSDAVGCLRANCSLSCFGAE